MKKPMTPYERAYVWGELSTQSKNLEKATNKQSIAETVAILEGMMDKVKALQKNEVAEIVYKQREKEKAESENPGKPEKPGKESKVKTKAKKS